MARGVLTVQDIVQGGLAPSYTAGDSANGHEFPNDGNVFLHCKCTGGSPITVTIQTPAKAGGLDIAEVTVVVPASTGDRMIPVTKPEIFNQAGGSVYVDLSGATGFTLAALRLPR